MAKAIAFTITKRVFTTAEEPDGVSLRLSQKEADALAIVLACVGGPQYADYNGVLRNFHTSGLYLTRDFE